MGRTLGKETKFPSNKNSFSPACAISENHLFTWLENDVRPNAGCWNSLIESNGYHFSMLDIHVHVQVHSTAAELFYKDCGMLFSIKSLEWCMAQEFNPYLPPSYDLFLCPLISSKLISFARPGDKHSTKDINERLNEILCVSFCIIFQRIASTNVVQFNSVSICFPPMEYLWGELEEDVIYERWYSQQWTLKCRDLDRRTTTRRLAHACCTGRRWSGQLPGKWKLHLYSGIKHWWTPDANRLAFNLCNRTLRIIQNILNFI